MISHFILDLFDFLDVVLIFFVIFIISFLWVLDGHYFQFVIIVKANKPLPSLSLFLSFTQLFEGIVFFKISLMKYIEYKNYL